MCFEADILTAQTSDTSRLFRTFFYCKSVMCICPNNLNTVARTWIQAAVSSIGDHAPRKSHSCVLQFGYISATKYPPKFPQNLFERKLYLTLLPGAATMTRTPHFFWLVVELPLTPMPVVGFEGAAWGLGVEGLLPPALLVCCQYVSTDVSRRLPRKRQTWIVEGDGVRGTSTGAAGTFLGEAPVERVAMAEVNSRLVGM